MRPKVRTSLLAAVSLLGGCAYLTQGIPDDDRGGMIEAAPDLLGDRAEKIVYLDQGWDSADSTWFYNTTQGSDLVPYEIFLHLEQADREVPFRDNDNIRRFRYLPQRPSFGNPDGLPVGWVKDSFRGKEYLGFTCAACHTTQINYQGTGIRIDGGPTMADAEATFNALEAALRAAVADAAKFGRLAKAVLGDDAADAEKRAGLRAELATAHGAIAAENAMNKSPYGTYGYARLDAFGRIFNRVLHRIASDANPRNGNPSTAPVSYPFLWDSSLHDYTQWNGLLANRQFEVLGRNTGEVMGVFATLTLEQKANHGEVESSADLLNLRRLERAIKQKLHSPLWPAVLPPIDQNLAREGRKVFEAYRCGTCHHDIGDRTSMDRRGVAELATLEHIGTDPEMAMSGATLKGLTGVFAGRTSPASETLGDLCGAQRKYGAEAPAAYALKTAVKDVLLRTDPDKWKVRAFADWIYLGVATLGDTYIKDVRRHVDHEIVGDGWGTCDDPVAFLKVYKARSLNGIWATAPYLHNGSVPNLYELFLPSCAGTTDPRPGENCRSTTFTVGSREFDARRVGFVQKARANFPALYEFDTSKRGNSNAGHEYESGRTPVLLLDGAGRPKLVDGRKKWETLPPITDQQRWALVEYLKTL